MSYEHIIAVEVVRSVLFDDFNAVSGQWSAPMADPFRMILIAFVVATALAQHF